MGEVGAASRTAADGGRQVVVAVGDPSHRDDGVGPRIVEALRARVPEGVVLAGPAADPASLLDLWDGADLAIVVDAMRSGARPGTVRRMEGGELSSAWSGPPTSSHGLSLRDAFELARAIGRLPNRLVLFLIEAGELGAGTSLTPEVARAVEGAVRGVLSELRPSAGRA